MRIDYEDKSDVIDKIYELSSQIDEELEKDTIDEEKVFKLRYAQLIKGFYLNQMNNNYNNIIF